MSIKSHTPITFDGKNFIDNSSTFLSRTARPKLMDVEMVVDMLNNALSFHETPPKLDKKAKDALSDLGYFKVPFPDGGYVWKKLNSEQRIARLEKLLVKEGCRGRRCEGDLTDDNHYDLLVCKDELKARLRREGMGPDVADVEIDDRDENVVVTLDWDYFGTVHYYVIPTAKGYNVEDDYGDKMQFGTLEGVAEYIAEEDAQAMADL